LTALFRFGQSGSQPSPKRGSRAARYRAPQCGASSDAPPRAAFSAVREASFRLPLTRSVAPEPDRPCGRPAREPRTDASAPLVKEGGVLRSSAPFHRREPPPRPLAQALQVLLAGFLQSKRCTSATAWTTPSRALAREVALARPGLAAALLRAPPAGASRSRGPGAALAAPASSRLCPEELPRNRSLPSTSLHEPVPRSGWRTGRVRRRRRENELTRGPRLREVRAATLRPACAVRSGAGFWPRPDHVTEGRPPCLPREGETRLAAPEVPSDR